MDLVGHLRSRDETEVAVHLPGLAELDAIVREAVDGAGKHIVALNRHSRVVVTADGIVEDGVVRCLKDEVDALAPHAARVIVFRHVGNAPLAPTLDAYLDIEMVEGRDVWCDE